jgi:hypothetical protein
MRIDFGAGTLWLAAVAMAAAIHCSATPVRAKYY